MSRLVKCENGHFYDADKYAKCPNCSRGAGPKKDVVMEGGISTDLDGVATTDNLVDKDGKKIILYVGTYYYREVSAPTRFHFDTTEHEFIVAKGKEVADVKIENTPFKLPQTGGFISTDGIIIIIVSVVSILGYVIINIIVNKKRFS